MDQAEVCDYKIFDLGKFDEINKTFPEEAWQKGTVTAETSASSDGGIEDEAEDEDFLPPAMNVSKLSKTTRPHMYLSFGIENNLLGKAAGMIHQHEYRQILKVIDGIDPNLLTQPFKNFMDEEKATSQQVNIRYYRPMFFSILQRRFRGTLLTHLSHSC